MYVAVSTDTSSHFNEASDRICYLLAQHQVPLTHAELFKKAFIASAELCSLVFRTKIRSCNRLGNYTFHPTYVPVDVMS